MGFLWPGFLPLLGIIPLTIAAYFLVLRHRRKFAVRYSSLALVRAAIPRTAWLRRHLPFAIFLLALASLILALSRPTATVRVPSGQATIMLSLDVSLSMCSTDIPPNRLKAAEAAVLSFVERQNAHTLIGIVEFAGFAEIVQTPTSDKNQLQAAVLNLTPARRTAIGSGILKAIDAIAEVNPSIAPSDDPGANTQPEPELTGKFAPDIIVVLSDGASNAGPEPMDAAQQAVTRGVRIYTIGYGTPNGATMNCGDQFGEPLFSGGGGFGGGGFFGGFRRGIDEETLKGVAEMTGGEYYSASSAGDLQDIFKELPTNLITREEHTEISVLFSAVGLLLAVLAILLSMVWHPLP